MQNKNYMVLLGDLTQKNLRRNASLKIAQLLGTRDLAILVKDPQIKLFIPAPGYGQILQNSYEWQSFLMKCSDAGHSSSKLKWLDDSVAQERESTITGISSVHADSSTEALDCVLVFLGEPIQCEMLDQLVGFLPLLASCIQYEWIALSAKNSEEIQLNEMKKSELLLQKLDKTRLELQNALYLSHKALNTRSDFMSVASHELKTPLQSIILEVGMLKRHLLKGPELMCQKKSIERFESLDIHLRRMSTLIDNLLDYSQVEEGKLIFNHQRNDLSEICANVIWRFRRQALDAGCEIFLDAPHPIFVSCDNSKIDQVISNLIQNAIKYGPNGDIHVGVSLSGDCPIVYVKDKGMGIPFVEQSKIFERFERCDNSQNVSGLGLGLFVVRQIVNGHGGTIAVQSEPLKGSTFTVSLPQNLNQMESRNEQIH